MPPPNHAQPFADVIEESLDEAAFLWGRWERELTSPTRSLAEIFSWTEDRLHGAIDGVRAAGEGNVDGAVEGLQSDDSGRVAVSAGALALATDSAAIAALVAALTAAEPGKLRAMVRGLELLGSKQGLRAAADALEARGPAGAAALCRLKAFRRAALGDEVKAAYGSGAPDFQAGAIRSVRDASSPQFDEMVLSALGSDDAGLRFAAVETGLCRGISGAWETAIRIAGSPGEAGAPYLNAVALLGKGAEHNVIFGALPAPGLQRQAIWALGHVGTVQAADACVAGMRHEALARAAGEAYCWITGADLERDGLARQETPPDAPAFEDDDLDANLVPAPEDLWPLPDADAVRAHWAARSSALAPGVRHIRGQPATGDTLLAMIESGPMLRRPDLVFELRVRTRGRYDVETRAFTARQRQMMATARAALLAGGGR